MNHKDASEAVVGLVLERVISPKKVDIEELQAAYRPIFKALAEMVEKSEDGIIDRGELMTMAKTQYEGCLQQGQYAKEHQEIDWLLSLHKASIEAKIADLHSRISKRIQEGNGDDATTKKYQAELEALEKTKATEGTSGLCVPLTAEDVLSAEYPPEEWLVEGLLPKGLTVFGGKLKAGKSVLALQLLRAIATGGTFLGRQATEGKVLYIDLEDSQRRLDGRMRKQGWAKDDNLHILLWKQYIQLIGAKLNEGGITNLKNIIDKYGYSFIVADTWGKMIAGNKDDYSLTVDAASQIQEASLATNSGIMLIHHLRKSVSKDDEGSWDDFLGSTGLPATADTLWKMVKDKDQDTSARFYVGGRDFYDIESDSKIYLVQDKPNLRWLEIEEADAPIPISKKEMARLKKIREMNGPTQTEIRKAFPTSSGKMMDSGYCSRMIDDWITRNLVKNVNKQIWVTDLVPNNTGGE